MTLPCRTVQHERSDMKKRKHDGDIMEWGTHSGKQLGDIPDSYWKWFLAQPWSVKYPDLVEYAKVCEEGD